MSEFGTFRTWPRWRAMSAVGGTAEVVARLVAIIEGWLDSLVASPKILRTQMTIVNEGPLLARSGRRSAPRLTISGTVQSLCTYGAQRARKGDIEVDSKVGTLALRLLELLQICRTRDQ